MSLRSLFYIIEGSLGCATVASANWLESKYINKVLSTDVAPPWDRHYWALAVVGLVGILLAIGIGFAHSKDNKIKSIALGIVAFIVGAIICGVFIPARG